MFTKLGVHNVYKDNDVCTSILAPFFNADHSSNFMLHLSKTLVICVDVLS